MSLSQNKALYGSPTPARGVHFVSGVIHAISSSKCTVLTVDGRQLLVDWPHSQTGISGAGADIRPPEQGQQVLIQIGSGRPFIAQTQAVISPRSAASRAFSLADTGQASSSLGAWGPMYQDMLPQDVQPGDRVQMGNQGQKIGILEGGVAVLSATPFAGVRAFQKSDTLQLFGRNTQLETGFGTLRFWDVAGKRGVDLVGGFDQKTESGTGRENWTVRMALGPNAQGMYDFGLYDRTGDPLFTQSIDTEGNHTVNQAGGFVRQLGGLLAENIAKGRSIQVQDGDDSLSVAGAWTRTVGGEASLASSGKMSLLSSSDLFSSARRDHVASVGRNATWNISGDPIQGTPASKALNINVSNGSVLMDVGNPVNLDLQKTKSGITLQTWLGDITLQSMMTGKVIVNTTLPGSVLLGANAGVAPYSAVIYEQLQTFLTTLISTVMAYLDTHTHGSVAPSIAPPTTPPIVPSTAMLAPLLAQMTLFKSLKVSLGG